MKSYRPLRPQGADEEFAYHGATWDRVHGTASKIVGGPGVKISRTTKGVKVSIDRPRAPALSQTFHFKSMEDDYLVCRTWDGTTEGDTDIYIAKVQELWGSVTTEVIDGVTVTYSAYDNASQTRTADNGTDPAETQVIVPRYRADGDDPTIIWAERGTSFVDDPDSLTDPPQQLTLIDKNRGGRAWAKVS